MRTFLPLVTRFEKSVCLEEQVWAFRHQRSAGNVILFLYNCISGYTDLNIDRYVTFVTHGRSRSKNPTLVLKPAYCKTATFQASFFNRIVKPWNTICNLAPQDKFSTQSLFKYFLRATYFTLLDTTYDIDMPCTWFLFRNCPCHRS